MKTELIGRIGHGNSGGHHPWISRDYADIDCKAVGCLYNINGKCATPSQAKITDSGHCSGFTLKPLPKEKDGD